MVVRRGKFDWISLSPVMSSACTTRKPEVTSPLPCTPTTYPRAVHSHALLRQTEMISTIVQGVVTTRKAPRLTRTLSFSGARSNPANPQKTRNPRLLRVPGAAPQPPQRLPLRFASATSSRKRMRRIILVTLAPGSSLERGRARAGRRAGFATPSRRAGGAATQLHPDVGECTSGTYL